MNGKGVSIQVIAPSGVCVVRVCVCGCACCVVSRALRLTSQKSLPTTCSSCWMMYAADSLYPLRTERELTVLFVRLLACEQQKKDETREM